MLLWHRLLFGMTEKCGNKMYSFYKNNRPSMRDAILEKPYTTFVQAHVMPRYRGIPTAKEKEEWIESRRDHADTKTLWLIAYMVYLIIWLEFIIGVALLFDISYVDIIREHGLLSVILHLFFSPLIIYFLLGSFINKGVTIVLEEIRINFDIGYSKKGEWTMIFVQSICFFLAIYLFVFIGTKLGFGT